MAEDFAGFQDEVWENMQKVWDDVQDKLGDMADTLNGATSWWDWVPGVGDDVSRAIEKFNNEIRPQIEKKINEVWEDVGMVVSEMAGNPAQLKQLSFAYTDCKTKLLYQAPTIEAELQQLGKYWTGDAFAAYSQAGTAQVGAMLSIAGAMDSASTMTNQAAQKILQLWIDLNDEIIRALTAIIRLLADATTVDKILSFEVPVVIDAIADILDFVQTIAKILEDYMLGVGFADQLQWRQLNNGVAGLPGNAWPVIHPGQVDDISNPGDWGPR